MKANGSSPDESSEDHTRGAGPDYGIHLSQALPHRGDLFGEGKVDWFGQGKRIGLGVGDIRAARQLVTHYYTLLEKLAVVAAPDFEKAARDRAAIASTNAERRARLAADLNEAEPDSVASRTLKEIREMEAEMAALTREGTGGRAANLEELRRKRHQAHLEGLAQFDLDATRQLREGLAYVNEQIGTLPLAHQAFKEQIDRLRAELATCKPAQHDGIVKKIEQCHGDYEKLRLTHTESLKKLAQDLQEISTKGLLQGIADAKTGFEALYEQDEETFREMVIAAAHERVPQPKRYVWLLGFALIVCTLTELAVANRFTAAVLNLSDIALAFGGLSGTPAEVVGQALNISFVLVLCFFPFVLSWGVKGLFDRRESAEGTPWFPVIVTVLTILYLVALAAVDTDEFAEADQRAVLVLITATAITAGGYLLHKFFDELSFRHRIQVTGEARRNAIEEKITELHELLNGKREALNRLDDEIAESAKASQHAEASLRALGQLADKGLASSSANVATAALDLGYSTGMVMRAGGAAFDPASPLESISSEKGSDIWRNLQVLSAIWGDGRPQDGTASDASTPRPNLDGRNAE